VSPTENAKKAAQAAKKAEHEREKAAKKAAHEAWKAEHEREKQARKAARSAQHEGDQQAEDEQGEGPSKHGPPWKK
jgi:hypothetical protein